MAKTRRRKTGKCLLCCMTRRDSSDEEDFPEIQPVPLIERVIEEEECESPVISTGNMSIASVDSKAALILPGGKGGAELHGGDAAVEPGVVRPLAKVVHFALCHEEPETKDTRENYRNTPVKHKSLIIEEWQEEYFFMRSKTADDYVKIPMSSFKTYVNEYVKNIVDSALESICEEECRPVSISDVTLDIVSIASDDDIAMGNVEEELLINDMVEEMLDRVVESIAYERAEFPSPSESNVSCYTDTGESASLDWDGYEPFLLREDPSSTDISIRYPEVSAGMEP